MIWSYWKQMKLNWNIRFCLYTGGFVMEKIVMDILQEQNSNAQFVTILIFVLVVKWQRIGLQGKWSILFHPDCISSWMQLPTAWQNLLIGKLIFFKHWVRTSIFYIFSRQAWPQSCKQPAKDLRLMGIGMQSGLHGYIMLYYWQKYIWCIPQMYATNTLNHQVRFTWPKWPKRNNVLQNNSFTVHIYSAEESR